MDVSGAVAVVTGGAGGIGQAIAAQLIDRGASVMLADVVDTVSVVASELGCRAWQGDCASEDGITELLARTRAELGEIDLYFANAGIAGARGLGESDADWDAILHINLRAHIRAAQALIPTWQARGAGCFVTTASAAGLLTQIGQAGYAVSKHAALAFAEWLSITYGDDGIQVACLCPMGVRTELLMAGLDSEDPAERVASRSVSEAGEVLSPEYVATCVMDAIDDGTFLILPHPEVAEMFQMKGSDYDRWLRGMRRYQVRLKAEARTHDNT